MPQAALILSCLQAELVEAQAIAEEKARELAVANGLVAEKTRQYAEVQRIAAESEQAAAALDDKFRMQMLETKAERCVNLLCRDASKHATFVSSVMLCVSVALTSSAGEHYTATSCHDSFKAHEELMRGVNVRTGTLTVDCCDPACDPGHQ